LKFIGDADRKAHPEEVRKQAHDYHTRFFAHEVVGGDPGSTYTAGMEMASMKWSRS
jgi:hypothetical protein